MSWVLAPKTAIISAAETVGGAMGGAKNDSMVSKGSQVESAMPGNPSSIMRMYALACTTLLCASQSLPATLDAGLKNFPTDCTVWATG